MQFKKIKQHLKYKNIIYQMNTTYQEGIRMLLRDIREMIHDLNEIINNEDINEDDYYQYMEDLDYYENNYVRLISMMRENFSYI